MLFNHQSSWNKSGFGVLHQQQFSGSPMPSHSHPIEDSVDNERVPCKNIGLVQCIVCRYLVPEIPKTCWIFCKGQGQ